MRLIILVICGLLFMQCSNTREGVTDKTVGYSFSKQENLLFKEVNYPELLGLTMQLVKMDSFLFINDFHGDSLISVYNLNTNKIIRKLVLAGNGPNEMISPLELRLVDNNLWVLCRPLHLLNHFPSSSIAQKPVLLKDGSVKAEADDFVPLGEKGVVFSGFWNKRYAYMDMDNKEVQEFGDYPDFWEDEKNMPIEAKAMFHQSRFAVNTNKHLFASCSYFVLEIYKYDPTGNELPKLKFRKQLGNYEYDFKAGKRVSTTIRPGADLVSIDVINGGEYLYIITQDDKNRKNRNIMVIDWDGKPVKLLKSGKRITCLEIDEKENIGYCIIKDPEDKLVYFNF